MKKLLSILILLALLTGCATNSRVTAETTAPTEATSVPETTSAPETPSVPETVSAPEDALTVHFIDVGQADCALLECGGDFALIDAGNTEDGTKIAEYLETEGVEQLDLVVGTHPHEDHIGGMSTVLHYYEAETIWFSEIPYVNSSVNTFLWAAEQQEKEIEKPRPGDTFQLGDALITVIGPVRTDYEDVNNLSLVLMVEYGNTRFLFTGDMESDAETELLDSGADVKADVLKVGHHGSYTSTSYRFLYEVDPTYAVIPVGAANDYGHPHDEPMSRLQDADVIIYRTDKMYTVVAVSDGETIDFTWGNSYAKPWMPEAA